MLFCIQTFSFKEMHFKMSSVKWHSFCLGLNVLIIAFGIKPGMKLFIHARCSIPLVILILGSWNPAPNEKNIKNNSFFMWCRPHSHVDVSTATFHVITYIYFLNLSTGTVLCEFTLALINALLKKTLSAPEVCTGFGPVSDLTIYQKSLNVLWWSGLNRVLFGMG